MLNPLPCRWRGGEPRAWQYRVRSPSRASFLPYYLGEVVQVPVIASSRWPQFNRLPSFFESFRRLVEGDLHCGRFQRVDDDSPVFAMTSNMRRLCGSMWLLLRMAAAEGYRNTAN